MRRMQEPIRLLAFVLIIVGTLGLLMNEFIFAWGRATTLAFAASSAIGLLTLGLTSFGGRAKHAT